MDKKKYKIKLDNNKWIKISRDHNHDIIFRYVDDINDASVFYDETYNLCKTRGKFNGIKHDIIDL